MKKLQFIVSVLLFLFLSGCSFKSDSSKRKANSPISRIQDTAMVKAASQYANFCASCHWDDLGWFKTRKWKYGNREEDIS